MESSVPLGSSVIRGSQPPRNLAGWRSSALAALLFVCVLTTATARDTVPAHGGAVDWERSGPNVDRPTPTQIDFLLRLEGFDAAYTRWQRDRVASPEVWLRLARETFGGYTVGDVPGGDDAFVLRGMLLRGECLAFAAVDLMHVDKTRAMELYREAVRTLDAVVSVGEADPERDALPSYGSQLVVMVDSSAKSIHPFAGYELVGTGSVGLAPLQWVSPIRHGGEYLDLAKHRERYQAMWADIVRFRETAMTYPRPAGELSEQQVEIINRQALARYAQDNIHTQRTSSRTARSLLAQLCPWGAKIYAVMADSGLVNEGLDFNVLDPFAAADPFHGADLVRAMAEAWASSDPGRLADHLFTALPKLSVVVLEEDAVPVSIRQEAEDLVGGADGISRDTLGLGGLKWHWVGEPTYTAWFVSPRVFDPNLSEQFGDFFDLIKLVSGGPLALALDKLLSGVTWLAETAAGPGSTAYWGSKVVVENADMGLPELIKDEWGLSGVAWMAGPELATKIGTIGLAMVDDYERQALYEGMDPRLLSLGRSYDGSQIPPIIVRADVLGFVAPPDDYSFWLHSQRFYVFRPEEFAHKNPELVRQSLKPEAGYFDLFEEMYFEHFGARPLPLPRPGLDLMKHHEARLARGEAYLAGDATVHQSSWPRLPGHHGARVLKFSSAPYRQRIVLPLTETSRAVIRQYGDLRLSVFSDSAATVAVASAPIESFDSVAGVDLCTHEVARRPVDTPTDRTFVRPCTAVDDLKAVYTLRVEQAGRVLEEREIVLDPGVARMREVTGTLRVREPGDVAITLEPPLDLLRLEAEVEEVAPGTYSGGTGGSE